MQVSSTFVSGLPPSPPVPRRNAPPPSATGVQKTKDQHQPASTPWRNQRLGKVIDQKTRCQRDVPTTGHGQRRHIDNAVGVVEGVVAPGAADTVPLAARQSPADAPDPSTVPLRSGPRV